MILERPFWPVNLTHKFPYYFNPWFALNFNFSSLDEASVRRPKFWKLWAYAPDEFIICFLCPLKMTKPYWTLVNSIEVKGKKNAAAVKCPHGSDTARRQKFTRVGAFSESHFLWVHGYSRPELTTIQYFLSSLLLAIV